MFFKNKINNKSTKEKNVKLPEHLPKPETWCFIQYIFGKFVIIKSETPMEETIRILIKNYKNTYSVNSISSRDKKRIVDQVSQNINKFIENLDTIDEVLKNYITHWPKDDLIVYTMKASVLDVYINKNYEALDQYLYFTAENNIIYLSLIEAVLKKLIETSKNTQ